MKTKVWAPLVALVAAIAVAVVLLISWLPGEGPSTPLSPRSINVGFVGMGDIPTLDPTEAATALPILLVWQTYDRLIDVGPSGELKPMLATKWSANESYTEWTFHIRSDVSFCPRGDDTGARTVTVGDVEASFVAALKSPGYGRTLLGDLVVGAKDLIEGKASTISGLEAADGHIKFRLTRPFAYLPERLATSFFSVVSAEPSADDKLPPLGSGPFYLDQWDRISQRVVLKRNPNYWGEVSRDCPAELAFRVIESEAAAVEEIRTGGVDWLETTSAILPLLKHKRDSDRLTVQSVPTTTVRLIALNTEQAPFKTHPKLGVALNMATDRAALVESIGAGDAIGGPLPREVLPDSLCWYTNQQQGAQDILQSLPADAKRLEMLVQPGHEPRIMAELLREQWAAVGIDVELRQGLADFFPRVIQGNYQMAIGYYGPFVSSTDQYLWLYRASAQPAPNVMRFTNQQFEDKLDAALATDEAEGRIHLDAALQVLQEEPPVVWLLRSPRIQVSRLRAAVPRSSGIPLFAQIELKDTANVDGN